MTRWALLIIVAAFALGLGRLERSRAVRAAIWLTAAVIVVVSARNGAL